MILADTSIWIGHFRKHDAHLAALLEAGEICQHPFVMGELACGNFRNREEVLAEMSALPLVVEASNGEVMAMLARHKLHGKGLGWVDLHLLASARLSTCRLYTADRALRQAAGEMGVGYWPMGPVRE